MARILVVDDETIVCDVLKDFFTLKGHEVHTALNGQAAIAKVKTERPHIVLLDILMPGMRGLKVLEEIKRLDPKLCVIMITGFMNNDLVKEAIALGAYDYITKPVDFEYLESVLTGKISDLLG
jgi:two-component system response regulator HydG